MSRRSSIELVTWPAVSTGLAAQLMALQRELDSTQWWPAERLRAQQFQQLNLLLTHAAEQVPYYSTRLRDAGFDPDRELTEASWARLPVLKRCDLQTLGDSLHARSIPTSHGPTASVATSGSSGVPVRVRKTSLDNLFWSALRVREEIWHRGDRRGTMARIRRVPPQLGPEQAALVRSADGLMLPDWGWPTATLWETGPLALMDDRISIADQSAFLRRLNPEYLFTFPANLRLLLAHFRESLPPLRSLRSVWTTSEVVDDALRVLCRDVWGCPIVDNYSAAETGYLAMQCPTHDHFHVPSEVVLLEVLDSDDRPCEPGQIGRVIITPLHNFAMPLLRYEIGDEAEVGEACACGRGLPVLRRIVGRSYDYLTTPSGQRRRVDSGHYGLAKIAAIREFQIVQRTLNRIELLLVEARPLSAADRAQIGAVLESEFGAEFRFEISVKDAIARTQAGKLRSFISELTETPP